jgi:hypothetical protein
MGRHAVKLATEDRLDILDLLARYCWLVDAGDGDGWADLWTEDGKFTGIPTPLQGRDQLRKLPTGKLRHIITNIVIAGATDGAATAKGYSTIYDFRTGQLVGGGLVSYTLVRLRGEWKIKALHAEFLYPPAA